MHRAAGLVGRGLAAAAEFLFSGTERRGKAGNFGLGKVLALDGPIALRFLLLRGARSPLLPEKKLELPVSRSRVVLGLDDLRLAGHLGVNSDPSGANRLSHRELQGVGRAEQRRTSRESPEPVRGKAGPVSGASHALAGVTSLFEPKVCFVTVVSAEGGGLAGLRYGNWLAADLKRGRSGPQAELWRADSASCGNRKQGWPDSLHGAGFC